MQNDNCAVNGADEAPSRRSFLGAATAVAGGLVAGCASPTPAPGAGATAARSAFDPATFTGPGFESETGTAIYNFPRDHAMHGGPWYRGAEYQETHYFTGFFNDKLTGKPYSVFFCWASYGWDAKLGRPVWVSLFSMTDIERKKFLQAVHPMSGKLVSTGSGPNVAAKAFKAEYVLGKDGSGNEGLFSYQSNDERFRWMANVPKPTDGLKNQTPYFVVPVLSFHPAASAYEVRW
jgi:hypothetical protein